MNVKYKVRSKNKKVILYKPRNDIEGSVVCHLEKVHRGKLAKGENFKLKNF